MKDNFCLQPWIGIHGWPDGSVFPCCMYNSKTPLGNLNQNSIEEILHNDDYVKLRQELLENKKPEGCRRCYQLEDANLTTLRQTTTARYPHLYQKIKQLNDTHNVELKYLDVRFSNICNFKCRTCGPELSNKWWQELHGTPGKPDAGVIQIPRDRFWDFYEKALETADEITFAGGEALMQEEHYKALQRLIQLKKFEISINYTTNLSVLKYKQYDLFDIWSNFKNIEIYASLDASGARGEYLRKGTDWNKIEENRKRLKQLSGIKFAITPTISLFNVWHFPDFHRDWVERDMIAIDDVRLNILTWPPRSQANMLKNKQIVIDKWQEHISWLQSKGMNDVSSYDSVINFLNVDLPNREELLKDFFRVNSRVDETRNENLFDVFPELQGQLDV